MLISAVEGFALGGGLIIAIGAQNAFILRQGVLQQHVFLLCLIASFSDAALILAGVMGVGTLVGSNQSLLFWITLGGAAFLAGYAVLAAFRAIWPNDVRREEQGTSSLGAAISVLLAFTFLNPHVYLDTVLLVGGVSASYLGAARATFAIGAMAASFVWFFGLGYGARWLSPIFERPSAWRVLDAIIAIIMALLSITLTMRAFN